MSETNSLPQSSNVAINIEQNEVSSSPNTNEISTRIDADQKLIYLDGLRGILCLIVVLNHALLMGKTTHDKRYSIFFQSWLHYTPLRLLVAGEFAVAGFFVLSGCVLVRRYLEHSNENIILISALIRRFPRLFIPSTIALFIYFAIFHFRALYGYTECHEVGEGSVDVESIDMGYVLLNTFGQYFWMSALYTIQWTMQVEYIGSLFVYLIAFLITRSVIRRYRIICYVFLLLILPITWVISHGGVPRAVQYIQPFMFGLLLSDLHAIGVMDFFHSIKIIWKILINLSLILLTIYFASYPVFNTDIVDGCGSIWYPFGWMFGWFWISFAGFCLIFLSMISKPLQTFLSSKIIHFLGKISFGIYLTHYILLCLLDISFINWTGPRIGHDLAIILGLIIVGLPCIFLIAYGFYLFVDAPAVQISYWIYYLVCRRCLKVKKRPQLIRTHIWIVLLILFFVSIIISSIPPPHGYEKCPNNYTGNLTISI